MMLASLSSCTYIPTVASDVITMITIDADARVEFMVNPENKVVSATPLNDIAAIIIFGEDFKGKKPDEAAADFISISAKAGLISELPVKLSVSGESDYVDVITEMISKKIVKSMKKAGIKGSVEMVEPMTRDELLALCLENGYIDQENLDNISYNRLVYTLATKRVSSRDFFTEEMKFLYNTLGGLYYDTCIKSETLTDLSLKQSEAGEIYAAYSSAVSSYKTALEEFEQFYVSSYFSENSEYQKALGTMRDAKEAVLNGSGSAEALQKATADLSEIISSIKNETNERLSDIKLKLSEINELEKTFEDNDTVSIHLKQTYLVRIARVKEKTQSFTADFNTKFEKELTFIKNSLSARKDNLL